MRNFRKLDLKFAELKEKYSQEYNELEPIYKYREDKKVYWPTPFELLQWLDKAIIKRTCIVKE
jgi:hypothetical protein